MNHYERNHQTIGRWTVFLRGEEVILQTTVYENNRKRLIERNLNAQEALLFLAWLSCRKDELCQIAAGQEWEAAE
jgi:hypothetical protein